jgi:hypothetical protein
MVCKGPARLNIQGLIIYGTEQSCSFMCIFGRCLLRVLATKSTTVVDYFVVSISFTIQMKEYFLKLVKSFFLPFYYKGCLYFFNSTNYKPATFKFFLRDTKAV